MKDKADRTIASLRPTSALLAAFASLAALAAVALLVAQPFAGDEPDPDDPDPVADLESLGVPIDEHMTPSTNLWREGNLLYGEAVEAGEKRGPFYAYDLTTRSVKYRGNGEIHTGFRDIAVDARGNAYFSVDETGLARYDPRTNEVTVLPVSFTAGFLRASTREAEDGWMYLATARPDGFYRFRPSTGTLEELGDLPGYTTALELDPGERYVYYMPHAHGSAYEEGAPVYRFDVRTRQHEVVASINQEIVRRYRYRIGGTYAFDIDPEGKHLYLSLNAVNLERDPDPRSGFGDPVIVVLEIPPPGSVATPRGGAHGSSRHQTPRFAFTDVSAATGIGKLLEGDYLHTASWGDVDGDGRLDIFAGTFASPRAPGGSAHLLLNRGGRFEDSGQRALALTGRAAGSVFADLDNDGDLDLFVSNNAIPGRSGGAAEPSRLLRNDGGGFTDVTAGSGTGAQASNGRAVGVLDYDGDGLLDLFIVADDLRGSGRTVLLRNEGDLRFTDVTAAAGIPSDIHGLGLAIGDVSGDGWPDIFVAGEVDQKRPNRNFLFVSNGDGTFHRLASDVFDWSPFTHGEEDWVSGAAMADLNRDGRPDLVVGHHFGSSSESGIGTPVRVYMNRRTNDGGDPVFEDITAAAGIPPVVSKQPHVEVQDFDNDGWPDVYASVLVEGADGRVPLVFAHTGAPGDPVFEPIDAIRSLSEPRYYAGGPAADFDSDGRVDVFLSEWRSTLGTPATSVLLRNTSASGNWLQVAVEGDPARGENRMGVGAVVTVRDPRDGRIVGVREISPSNGFSSSQPALAHFGLGSLERVDVTVRMPFGGRTLRREGVAANGRLRISEGDTGATTRVDPGGGGTAHGDGSDPDDPAASGSSAIVHFVPVPLPDYEAKLWSTWGGAIVASNGKFYAAIGDHRAADGNSFLYEFDPATGEIRIVGDVLSVVPHVAGEFGHGKIHSRINEARDGYLYMTSYRGSRRGIRFTETYRGSVILRYPVTSRAGGG
ncbi:MAG: CRTAC1 family protein [Gemmatimonadota bacterium]|nr:CRTAC1 family protein [Gemmatimonadota bacterium]